MIKVNKAITMIHNDRFLQNVDWSKWKAIVFESDDWGLCSYTPSSEKYGRLSNQFPADLRLNAEDSLETTQALDNLFTVLKRFSGGDNCPAVFQPNYILSNPDYAAIAMAKVFSAIPITQFPEPWGSPGLLDKIKQGIREGVWYPEFHGYTHYNVNLWMDAIRRNDPGAHRSLQEKSVAFWAAAHRAEFAIPRAYYDSISEFGSRGTSHQQENAISKGLAVFEKTFGRPATSFIAPAYCWQQRTESILLCKGISVIQAKDRQHQPDSLLSSIRRKICRAKPKKWCMGETNNKSNLRYLVRNVDFEPYQPDKTYEPTFTNILDAWKRGEPAIVSTHRVNYAGVNSERVKNNLHQLAMLLDTIGKACPEAVYLTDCEIGQLYERGIAVRKVNATEMLVRNFTSGSASIDILLPPEITVDGIFSQPHDMVISTFAINDGLLKLTVAPGHYRIKLKTKQ